MRRSPGNVYKHTMSSISDAVVRSFLPPGLALLDFNKVSRFDRLRAQSINLQELYAQAIRLNDESLRLEAILEALDQRGVK